MKALYGNGGSGGSGASRGARQGGGNGRLMRGRARPGVRVRSGSAAFLLNRNVRRGLGRGTR